MIKSNESGKSTTLYFSFQNLKVERVKGLEPSTTCLEGRSSSQLSYTRVSFKWWSGVDSNHRTHREQIYSLPSLAT